MIAGPDTSYELYEGSARLAELQGAWEELEESGADHIFQTYAFARLWQDNVGDRAGATPLVVALREGHRIVGIFPACRVRARGVPLLTWLGAPRSLDYGDVLFDATVAVTPVADFVAESLRIVGARARGAVLYLPNVREDSRSIHALRDVLRVYRTSVAPYARIQGTWEQFLSTRKRLRKKLNHGGHQIRKLGEAEYRLLLPGDPGVAAAMERLTAFKRERYDAPGAKTNLFDPSYVAFRTAQATMDPHSRVSTLSLDGKCIAVQLDAVFRGRMYGFLTGFDSEYAVASPGVLLLEFAVRSCFENGWDPYDFGWGAEPHKYFWADCETGLTSFVSDGPVGVAIAATANAWRRIREARAKKCAETPAQGES